MAVSVSYLFEKIRNCLPREEIQLQGILQKNDKYFVLVDEKDKDYKVNILGKNLDTIPLNSFITVKGMPVYPTSKSGLWINFNVGEIEKVDNEDYQSVAQLYQIEEQLPQKTFRSLYEIINNSLLQKEKVKFAVIYGKNAQTHKDFEKAFQSEILKYSKYVEIDFFQSSFADSMLVQTFEEVYQNNYDFTLLVRGGGAKEDLQSVGGLKTALFIIEKNIPFFIALGHTLDKGLAIIEKVADGSFSTPSLAGTEIGKAIKNTITILELNSLVKELEIKSVENTKEKEYLKEKTDTQTLIINNLENQVNSLKQKIDSLNKSVNKNLFYNLLFFIAGFIICFILVKIL